MLDAVFWVRPKEKATNSKLLGIPHIEEKVEDEEAEKRLREAKQKVGRVKQETLPKTRVVKS